MALLTEVLTEEFIAIVSVILTFIAAAGTALLNYRLQRREQQKELLIQRDKALLDEYIAMRHNHAMVIASYFQNSRQSAITFLSNSNNVNIIRTQEDLWLMRQISDRREELDEMRARLITNASNDNDYERARERLIISSRSQSIDTTDEGSNL